MRLSVSQFGSFRCHTFSQICLHLWLWCLLLTYDNKLIKTYPLWNSVSKYQFARLNQTSRSLCQRYAHPYISPSFIHVLSFSLSPSLSFSHTRTSTNTCYSNICPHLVLCKCIFTYALPVTGKTWRWIGEMLFMSAQFYVSPERYNLYTWQEVKV